MEAHEVFIEQIPVEDRGGNALGQSTLVDPERAMAQVDGLGIDDRVLTSY